MSGKIRKFQKYIEDQTIRLFTLFCYGTAFLLQCYYAFRIAFSNNIIDCKVVCSSVEFCKAICNL